MTFDKPIASALFATLAAACASTPAPQTLAAVGNSSAASSGAVAAAAASNAVAPSPSDVDASFVKAGYSVMRRYGEVFYCRNEVITGQRIGTRICLTAAQIQVEKQNVTKARDLLNQPANRCLGASCTN